MNLHGGVHLSVSSHTRAHILLLSSALSLTLKPFRPLRACHAGVAGAEGYHPSGYSPQWHTSLLQKVSAAEMEPVFRLLSRVCWPLSRAVSTRRRVAFVTIVGIWLGKSWKDRILVQGLPFS